VDRSQVLAGFNGIGEIVLDSVTYYTAASHWMMPRNLTHHTPSHITAKKYTILAAPASFEERATPTATDKIIHGNGHVVYFLVHWDDNCWVAAMFASDVFNTLVYTYPRLTMANVYRKGVLISH
jgi:hypothetical protein